MLNRYVCSLKKNEYAHFKEMINYLGKGEASCIAFAKARKAIVVTDDRTVRKQGTSIKIPITGTIGILKASVIDGLSTVEQAGFYSPVNSISNIISCVFKTFYSVTLIRRSYFQIGGHVLLLRVP